MDEHAALLDTIAAAPADDLPRLVYADWLEDRGDPDRAAFIRAHVALARTRPGTPAFERLAATASDLFRAGYRRWLGGLVLPGEMGWPDVVSPRVGGRFSRRHRWHLVRRNARYTQRVFDGGEFTFHHAGPPPYPAVFNVSVRRGLADELLVLNRRVALDGHPVVALSAWLHADRADFALDQPALGRVRRLRLEAWEESSPAGLVDAVAGSPHWRNLRTLEVSSCYEPDAADARVVAAFAAAPAGRLVRVLRTEFFDPNVMAALAGWPADAGLEELCPEPEPDNAVFAGRGLAGMLADLPVARTLQRLSLNGAALGDRVVAALATGPAWDQLTALNVGQSGDPQEDYAALATAAAFPAVHTLVIPDSEYGDTAALAFAGSDWPARLKVLDLSRTAVTIAGLVPLARAMRDGPLQRLRLANVALAPDDMHLLRDILGPRVRFA